jgi:hypothetical protein
MLAARLVPARAPAPAQEVATPVPAPGGVAVGRRR